MRRHLSLPGCRQTKRHKFRSTFGIEIEEATSRSFEVERKSKTRKGRREGRAEFLPEAQDFARTNRRSFQTMNREASKSGCNKIIVYFKCV